MAINSPPQPQMIDPNELAGAVTNIAAQSRQLLTKFMRSHGVDMEANSDPFGLLPAFVELTASWASDPVKLLDAQFHAWQSYMLLWQHSAQAFMGLETEPVVTADNGDRRFKDADWDNHPFFDYIKQKLTSSPILRSPSTSDGSTWLPV